MESPPSVIDGVMCNILKFLLTKNECFSFNNWTLIQSHFLKPNTNPNSFEKSFLSFIFNN